MGVDVCFPFSFWKILVMTEKKSTTLWDKISVSDSFNPPLSRELQSLNFSGQYASNPDKQLAWHLEHMGIRGLI